MTTKKCCNCKEEKPLEEFSIKDKKKGIIEPRCKICKIIYIREYYKKNREKILAYSKSYKRDKSPERLAKQKEYQKNYYQQNKEKFKEYSYQYYKNNKERVRKYSRDFYAKHGRKKKTDDV